MAQSLSSSQFEAALRAVDADAASPAEKVEMLIDIALQMQARPKDAAELHRAVELYERALGICPPESPLLAARTRARMGTALQALPDGGVDALRKAEGLYEQAIPTLHEHARPQEAAETEMNLGLVTQTLAGMGYARINDAIQWYHRALRTFTRDAHPQEYAILHNNLAVAYLSIPLSDERARMREALAVQSFEEVLKIVTLVDHPSEYAMLQNNLGNALQYAASGHPLENNLRALAAYDEALKVRTVRDTPLEYANTIANKANVLRNLPADPEQPGSGRDASLDRATALYQEARQIFLRHRQEGSASLVESALAEIAVERGSAAAPRGNGASGANGNGAARI